MLWCKIEVLMWIFPWPGQIFSDLVIYSFYNISTWFSQKILVPWCSWRRAWKKHFSKLRSSPSSLYIVNFICLGESDWEEQFQKRAKLRCCIEEINVLLFYEELQDYYLFIYYLVIVMPVFRLATWLCFKCLFEAAYTEIKIQKDTDTGK